MQIEKIETSTPLIPTKQTTMLQKIQHWLQKILGNSRTPQEIYNFLTHLSVITRNEFIINKDLYKEQENSRLFAYNIEKQITEELKQNKYYNEWNYIQDTHRFRFSSEVHGITPHEIQTIEADWLHPINPEKFYSVNNMTVILHLPLYDLRRLLKVMKPININITTNHCMTEVDKNFKYYALWDIVIKYIPLDYCENEQIEFDVITFIKESSFSDKNCFDWGHFRKLVWIAKPYEAIKTPQITWWGQQKILDQ